VIWLQAFLRLVQYRWKAFLVAGVSAIAVLVLGWFAVVRPKLDLAAQDDWATRFIALVREAENKTPPMPLRPKLEFERDRLQETAGSKAAFVKFAADMRAYENTLAALDAWFNDQADALEKEARSKWGNADIVLGHYFKRYPQEKANLSEHMKHVLAKHYGIR